MGRIELLEPYLQGGLHNTNFFNGRLLSAEDLRTEQEAARQQAARLGAAVGAGVVWGLEVREAVIPSSPAGLTRAVVTVSRGAGINAAGQLLSLPADTEVALVRERESAAPEAGLFHDCGEAQTTTVAVGAGLYVLALSPASGFAGKALASGLGGTGLTSPGCGSRYAVEGVRFKLVRLQLDGNPAADAATAAAILLLQAQTGIAERARLRNLLAHVCLGTPQWLAFGRDLYADMIETDPASSFGALEALRQSGELTDCDIPLAVVQWGDGGIGFVDRWAVRRTVEPLRTEGGYPAASASRRAYTRATVAQFVEQVRELFEENAQNEVAGLGIASLFAYVPPAGLVPIVTGGSPSGFALSSFFGARASGTPTTIRAANMFALLRHAEAHLPVDVAATDIFQLYWVDENLSAVQGGGGSEQLYLLYTSRELHGGRERDKVAQTLRQTWKSYSGVLKKSVLLPKTLTAASMPVWVSIQSAQQSVIQYAMAQEGAAASRALDRAGAMSAFSGLYDLQKELAQLLASTFAGDTGLAMRQAFANQLTQRLDTKLPNNAPALKTALNADHIHNAVAAQQSINTLVSSWSGEVAFGHVLVQHQASPRGTVLKPGDVQAFPYTVLVRNNTDKTATIELAAAVTQSTSGTWGDAVTIRNALGQIAGSVTLNPTQQTQITVEVRPPADALPDGQLVRIKVDAAIPPPTGVTWSTDIDLHTGAEEVEPSAYELRPVRTSQPSLNARTNPPTGVDLEFTFNTTYFATRPPTEIDFVYRVAATVAGGSFGATTWQLFFKNVTSTPLNGTAGAIERQLRIATAQTSGVPVTVVLRTPQARTAQDQVVTFTVEARANFIDSQSGGPVELSAFVKDQATSQTEQFTVTLQGTVP